ncbi:hypothetical protein ES703_45794 [subsurface metagenome]
MKKINIFINNQKFGAELNETVTAQKIYESLPIEAEGNFWGNEIYFEIPVEMENEKPTENLEVGDLAFWPSGNGLCIFYGQTPASNNHEPKPASPVTIVGKIKASPEELKKLKEAKIKIEKTI